MSDLKSKVTNLAHFKVGAGALFDQARLIMREWPEEDHVEEVILSLLGLADHLGRDRVIDWDSEKAMALAREFMAGFDVNSIETEIIYSSE